MADYTNIDDPSAYFQTTLYTGNATADTSITNDGNSDLQPDWIWIKRRDSAADHNSFDSSRGAGAHLAQNQTQAEQTVTGVTAFNSDGFTLSTNGDSNANTGTFVAWQWHCNGGTTASNSDGSTTATVQANTTAGFSIITWTGTGSATTVGHGLGVAPAMLIVKNRATAVDWAVYHKDLTDAGYVLALNSSDGEADSGTNRWNDTDPTSSVFSVGSGQQTNQDTNNMVCYAFAEVQGYSKFGTYRGNSSTNGSFVYLGFKPRWVMIKSTSDGVGWFMHDTKRSPENVIDDYLRADVYDQQGTSATIRVDFLSNGFKLRYGNNTNFSSHDYVYMAFAENPFVTSTGIPTTAR
jgi:hypothetical protein